MPNATHPASTTLRQALALIAQAQAQVAQHGAPADDAAQEHRQLLSDLVWSVLDSDPDGVSLVRDVLMLWEGEG